MQGKMTAAFFLTIWFVSLTYSKQWLKFEQVNTFNIETPYKRTLQTSQGLVLI